MDTTINATRPHELVTDPEYFERVLEAMQVIPKEEDRRARLGILGKGHWPNPQVEYPEGHALVAHKFPFNGRTGKPHYRAPKPFKASNLTEQFTWDEIMAMRDCRLGKKPD